MCRVQTHRFYLTAIGALLVCMLFATGCPKPKEPAPSDAPETGYDITLPANQGDVHGIVYVDGRPQAFGIVQIYDTSENKLKECRTNTEGSYTLCDFAPGRYILRYINAVGNRVGEDVEIEILPARDIEKDLKFAK